MNEEPTEPKEDGSFLVTFSNSIPKQLDIYYDDGEDGVKIADILGNGLRQINTYLGHNFFATEHDKTQRISPVMTIVAERWKYTIRKVGDEIEEDTSGSIRPEVKKGDRDHVDSDGVLVLYDDTHESALSSNDIILVEYYAPWCGHCKQLAPEWAKAAKQLKEQSIPAKLAKVDATEEKGVAKTVEIKGFPTLKYYKSGVASDYTGGRTAGEIVSWLKKKTGPAAKHIVTVTELSNAERENDVVVVGIFSNVNSNAAKLFLEVATEDNSAIHYVSTVSNSIKNKLKIPADDGLEHIVLLKHFDDGRADMIISVDLSNSTLVEFIREHSTPLVYTFSAQTSKQIFGSNIKVCGINILPVIFYLISSRVCVHFS